MQKKANTAIFKSVASVALILLQIAANQRALGNYKSAAPLLIPPERAWHGRGMATRLINRIEANDGRISAFPSLQ
jgi:hypothetical protein